MKQKTEVFDSLFAQNSDWANHLCGEHYYPIATLKQGLDFLAVFRDEGHQRPLMLISSNGNGSSDSTLSFAKEKGFPIVVRGMPGDSTTIKLGVFDSDTVELSAFPSWMPRHPRTSLVPRSMMLLPFESDHHLRSAFAACHDAVYKALANDPAASFDLLLLVIAAKIRDEQLDGASYEFATVMSESAEQLGARLNRLILETSEWLNEKIGSPSHLPNLSPSLAEKLVRQFQDFSLTLTAVTAGGTDVLGTAYETIVGATFRGELGSYFTPRNIADFMAQLLDLRRGRVLDPACGSAGLLISVKRSVGEQEPPLELYGNDLNPRMVRAARVNFLLHGLAPTHVVEGDGLKLDRLLRDLVGTEAGEGVWMDALPDGPFDAVVANPPFAGFETDPDNLSRTASAFRADGSLRSLNRTLPFIEAILASLRIGGVAGLVLPTSVLNAEEDSFVKLREKLLERAELLAIVGLPEKAFVHTDCGVHGVLVFFKRVRKPRKNYNVFVAWARKLGYDRLGRPQRENDFPEIIQKYREKPWAEENSFPISLLTAHSRWDPAWLHVVRSLPSAIGDDSDEFVQLSELLTIRNAKISRRDIEDDGIYRYFEVGDADIDTGQITRIHETTGFELRKKGRIKNRVRAGDVLLPNHRDSLIAKGAPTGRSAVLVTEAEDGVLTTDRFLVLTPRIDAGLLRCLLNSAGIRRQIVAQCRGAASLDVREKTLSSVVVPKVLLEESTQQEVISTSERLHDLRMELEEGQQKLAALIELAFGSSSDDFRPAGSSSL